MQAEVKADFFFALARGLVFGSVVRVLEGLQLVERRQELVHAEVVALQRAGHLAKHSGGNHELLIVPVVEPDIGQALRHLLAREGHRSRPNRAGRRGVGGAGLLGEVVGREPVALGVAGKQDERKARVARRFARHDDEPGLNLVHANGRQQPNDAGQREAHVGKARDVFPHKRLGELGSVGLANQAQPSGGVLFKLVFANDGAGGGGDHAEKGKKVRESERSVMPKRQYIAVYAGKVGGSVANGKP